MALTLQVLQVVAHFIHAGYKCTLDTNVFTCVKGKAYWSYG